MGDVVIDEIRVSARVDDKIRGKHQLTCDDVQEAVHRRTGARIARNAEGEECLLVKGVLGDREIRVVLYPTDEAGVWNLATAFPVQ